MSLPRAVYQLKFGYELILQTCGTVPDDLQSAALRGSFQHERRHVRILIKVARYYHLRLATCFHPKQPGFAVDNLRTGEK